jgi:hypothetical protein
MKRKYTVFEIDRMRNAVALMVRDRGNATERIIEIEEKLRTYIFNATEPDELDSETLPQRVLLASRRD